MGEDTYTFSDLQQYGDKGWKWNEKYCTWDYHKNKLVTYSSSLRTNMEGDGLWSEERQITGTCQFSLPSNRTKTYRKLRYYYTGK